VHCVLGTKNPRPQILHPEGYIVLSLQPTHYGGVRFITCQSCSKYPFWRPIIDATQSQTCSSALIEAQTEPENRLCTSFPTQYFYLKMDTYLHLRQGKNRCFLRRSFPPHSTGPSGCCNLHKRATIRRYIAFFVGSSLSHISSHRKESPVFAVFEYGVCTTYMRIGSTFYL